MYLKDILILDAWLWNEGIWVKGKNSLLCSQHFLGTVILNVAPLEKSIRIFLNLVLPPLFQDIFLLSMCSQFSPFCPTWDPHPGGGCADPDLLGWEAESGIHLEYWDWAAITCKHKWSNSSNHYVYSQLFAAAKTYRQYFSCTKCLFWPQTKIRSYLLSTVLVKLSEASPRALNSCLADHLQIKLFPKLSSEATSLRRDRYDYCF